MRTNNLFSIHMPAVLLVAAGSTAAFGAGPILEEAKDMEVPAGFHTPTRLAVDGVPIDVGGTGYATPELYDWDSDGDLDLLVGIMSGEGGVQIYANIGSDAAPKYAAPEWFKAGGEIGRVPVGWCMSFSPRFADIDGDGNDEIISGSWETRDGGAGSIPGHLYVFKKNSKGSYDAPELLLDKNGKPLVLTQEERDILNSDDKKWMNGTTRGTMTSCADWDGDGDIDLFVGTVSGGHVFYVENEGTPTKPAFAVVAKHVVAGGVPMNTEYNMDRKLGGKPAPTVADWDNDGDLDLFVGYGSGVVHYHENVGSRTVPKLAAAKEIVRSKSIPLRGAGAFVAKTKEDCFRRVSPNQAFKVCVVDYNNDGLNDLLLGDVSIAYSYHGDFTPAQKQEQLDNAVEIKTSVPKLRALYKKYYPAGWKDGLSDAEIKSVRAQYKEETTATRERVTELRKKQREYDDIIRQHYTGYVWLYLQKVDA